MNATNTIKCTDGLMLPCWQPLDNVSTIDKVGRGLIYFLALMYLFIGVSIIADRFMGAIEVITSQEREVTIKKPNGKSQIIIVRIWNETVANLTLMALGSSAPEILLSIIEIIGKNFEAGELGPGTIVGSAAYNLFVITAICVFVIPDGEVKKIKHLRVFIVTATWSFFAYVWLYLILLFFSPGEVEVWEALLTFFFFPLTVISAYLIDRKFYKFARKSFRKNRRDMIVETEGEDLEMGRAELLGLDVYDGIKQEYLNTLQELKQLHPQADLRTLEKMAHESLLNHGPKSRAFYRVQATRKLMGSVDPFKKIPEKAQYDLNKIKEEIQRESGLSVQSPCNCRIFFEPTKYVVVESCGGFEICIVRTGDVDRVATVNYYSEDGTAQAGIDYLAVKGTLTFAPGEREKRLALEVIDDDVFEGDKNFFVKLCEGDPSGVLEFGTTATIIVFDDDHGGLFRFEEQNHELIESVGTYELRVIRCLGSRERVIVPYWTEDGTAKAGKEYEPVRGQLIFEDNESEKTIPLTIIEEDSYEKDVLFYVQLGEPQMSGDEVASLAAAAEKKRPEHRTEQEKVAIMGKPRLGDIVRAQIRVKESKEFKNTVDKLVQRANASLLIGTSSWKEQFIEAMTVSASDESDEKKPSGLDYVLHVITLFWKVLFAFVPPTDMFRGYLCFFVSIVIIGIVTAVIGDVASHFGATCGMADSVTAIVFVALGTSIPDTFASKVAAVHDKHADASIGNVTGSNAVNVFLGIGVAWSIAAIYHKAKGRTFTVEPGNLAFSVTIFCTEAAVTVMVLMLRRTRFVGGELGGPKCLKYLTSGFLFTLWIIYLTMSTLEVYDIIEGF